MNSNTDTINCEHHISSVIIQTPPQYTEDVCHRLDQFPKLEIGCIDDATGKIIVVIETENEQQIKTMMDTLDHIDGVASVSMVYHHSEPVQSFSEKMV